MAVPDFNVKTPAVDPTAFATVLQRKAQIEQETKSQNFNDLLNAVTTGQKIASNMMDLAQKRNQQQGLKDLTDIMTSPNPQPPTPTASSSMLPEQGKFAVAPSPEQMADFAASNQDRTKKLTAALAKANPEKFTEYASKAVFKSDPNLDLQAKSVLYNGAPIEALFDKNTGNYYDASTKQQLTGKIEPYSLGSPLAEVRRAALINKMNEDLPKTMNPANWHGTSPAATSAKVVANAVSATALADQILSGQIPANSQSMANLNTEVARVLSQTGQITDTGRHELETKTGYAKLADAEQFFLNHPTDRKANAFVQVLKTEMQRQRVIRERTINSTMKGNLSSFQELRKLDPEAWEAGLESNGIDSKMAKQGVFKLKDEFYTSLGQEEATKPQGVPEVGGTYNGAKVLKVTRIK